LQKLGVGEFLYNEKWPSSESHDLLI